MKNYQEFLPLLYSFTHIPIYCFSDQELLFSLPADGTNYLPPVIYRQLFLQQNRPLAYLLTEFDAIYGFGFSTQPNEYLISGPVSSVSYSKKMLQKMHKIYDVSPEHQEAFDSYFQRLPQKNLEDFFNYLSCLHYALHDEIMIPHDIMEFTFPVSNNVSAQYLSLEYHDKELEISNNSYYIERQMLTFVERGDLLGLQRFSVPSEINGGIIADTMLRQLKNMFIVTITLVSRAAIAGGLPTSIAFHLSDSYILQMEGMLTVSSIRSLTNQMLLDYTQRVAEAKAVTSSNPVLFKAIQYARQNTNRRISVADIADHVGLSRNYLSAYFKKEIGFELGAFILRCKLEESRELLLYTDKTLTEISNYLCFSSQSHFQRAFKKQYGTTPLHYRKQINLK